MSQTLTLEHFDDVITAFKSHTDERFDAVERRLDKMDERFDQLERLLAVKDRVDRIEILLAEKFGRDVLARAGL
jgi:phosphate uptake regulator